MKTKPKPVLTDKQESELRREYGQTPTRELATRFGLSRKQVNTVARKLGLRFSTEPVKDRAEWDDEKDSYVREHYVTTDMDEMKARLGMSRLQISRRASRLGIRLSPEERKRRVVAGARKSGEAKARQAGDSVGGTSRREYEISGVAHLAMCQPWRLT